MATGLVLTGAAFLLDPTKIADRPWRLALTIVLAALLASLGMAGYLANRATAKILTYWAPSPKRVLQRATLRTPDARRQRAFDLLKYTNENPDPTP